jgi:hypothetical protein
MKHTLAVLVFVGLTLATTGRADISGSNPYAPLPVLDGCVGCLFAYIPFGAANAGQTVVSYQFFNGAGAGTANFLTPVLLEQNSVSSFTILGIGQSSTGFAAGYNSEPFVLESGTATVVGSGTFFGYFDGSVNDSTWVATGNTGTIPSNYPTGPGAPGYFTGYTPVGQPAILSLTAGQTLDSFDTYADFGQNGRTYSLQVTTNPEPSFYGLLAFGLLGGALILNGRRRRLGR